MTFEYTETQLQVMEMIRDFANKHIKGEVKIGRKSKNSRLLRRIDYSSFCEFARKEYNIHIKFKCDKIDDLILNIYSNNSMLSFIDWYELELITQRIFAYLGYEIKPTKKTRDNGLDMLAYTSSPFHTMTVIECKSTKRNNKIQVTSLRQLAYVVDKLKANQGVLVTNYEFSKDLIKEALEFPFKIILINGKRLLNFIRGYVHQYCNYEFAVC